MLLVRETSANSVPIVDLAKELAKDPEALSRLKMERTAYGYKLENGVAKTFEDSLPSISTTAIEKMRGT